MSSKNILKLMKDKQVEFVDFFIFSINNLYINCIADIKLYKILYVQIFDINLEKLKENYYEFKRCFKNDER